MGVGIIVRAEPEAGKPGRVLGMGSGVLALVRCPEPGSPLEHSTLTRGPWLPHTNGSVEMGVIRRTFGLEITARHGRDSTWGSRAARRTPR